MPNIFNMIFSGRNVCMSLLVPIHYLLAFLAAFYYEAYLAVSNYSSNIFGIINLAIGTIGLMLISPSKVLVMSRARRFNDGVM